MKASWLLGMWLTWSMFHPSAPNGDAPEGCFPGGGSYLGRGVNVMCSRRASRVLSCVC